MSKIDATVDMGEDAEFGWCIAVVLMPSNGKDRFYGPFSRESDARKWINKQPFGVRSQVGIMPLRKTDVKRTYDNFYNPLLDWDAEDFWSCLLKDALDD